MFMKIMLSSLASLALLGCSAEVEHFDDAEDAAAVDSNESPLYTTGKHWPVIGNYYPIQVCHQPCALTTDDWGEIETQAQCDNRRAKVDTAIRAWALNTRLSFPAEISTCPNSEGKNLDWISVRHKSGGGVQAWTRVQNGEVERKGTLGYPNGAWEVYVRTEPHDGVIRHEFGHALGFMHEYLRDDEPSSHECDDDAANSSGTKLTSNYDVSSIMNYRYCSTPKQTLSKGDVVGAQSVYGKPFTRSITSMRYAHCLHQDVKLGPCDDREKWYLQNERLRMLTADSSNQWLSDNSGAGDGAAPTIVTSTANSRTKWEWSDLQIRSRGDECLTAYENANGAIMLGAGPHMEPCSASKAELQTWRLVQQSGGDTGRRFLIELVAPTTRGQGYLIVTSQNAVSLTDLAHASVLEIASSGGRISNVADSSECLQLDGPVTVGACTTESSLSFLSGRIRNQSTGRFLKAGQSASSPAVVTHGTCTDATCYWNYRP
jgi:Astacin (Peptidase family M12A)